MENSRSILDRLFDCVNNGVLRTIQNIKTKSVCPNRRKKSGGLVEEESGDRDGASGDKEADSSPSCPCPREPPLSQPVPDQYEQFCYIKMQDPYAPCCCESKPKLPPCPPKRYKDEPREPTCGCDYCKKRNADSKCCDKKYSSSTTDPRYFEEA